MSYEQAAERLHFLVYGDDEWRANMTLSDSGVPMITYDAHGLSVLQAKKNIEDIACIYRFPIQLEVIHGFNHGTAIKDMLKEINFNNRLVSSCCPADNPGVTLFRINAV